MTYDYVNTESQTDRMGSVHDMSIPQPILERTAVGFYLVESKLCYLHSHVHYHCNFIYFPVSPLLKEVEGKVCPLFTNLSPFKTKLAPKQLMEVPGTSSAKLPEVTGF